MPDGRGLDDLRNTEQRPSTTTSSTMASPAVGGNPENASKFLEALQSDLKVLASETKKKYPQIKEVCRV